MMRQFWFLLFAGACLLSLTLLLESEGAQLPKRTGGLFSRGAAVKIDPDDEAILRRADLAPTSETLANYLKKRILSEKERPKTDHLISRLGSAELPHAPEGRSKPDSPRPRGA